jgi:hypothetical protein
VKEISFNSIIIVEKSFALMFWDLLVLFQLFLDAELLALREFNVSFVVLVILLLDQFAFLHRCLSLVFDLEDEI